MIRVEGLKYAIGGFPIDVDLTVANGQYFVLLGMTGSGKTLFLENLCGLRSGTGGRILLNGCDITCAEPRERRLGYVPQDGALFEHLDVRRNMGFSLYLRGGKGPGADAEVERIAELLHIPHLLNRRIRGLSGGERQRVALGRALISRPEALILDEPVSALDEYTRQAVCEELRRIQRELKLPVIHVCHSFEEAKLVADRVGVMHKGRIVQTAAADELMNAPANMAVAKILRLENIFPGQASTGNGHGTLRYNNLTLLSPPAQGPVNFIIKSWEIRPVSTNTIRNSTNSVKGMIQEITLNGYTAKILLEAELRLTFYLSRHIVSEQKLAPGKEIEVFFGPEAIHLLKD